MIINGVLVTLTNSVLKDTKIQLSNLQKRWHPVEERTVAEQNYIPVTTSFVALNGNSTDFIYRQMK